MRYRSQSVAYWYFAVAMVLFGLQLVFGLLSAAKYLGPDPLLYILPFDVTKVIHTNLLIVWVLTGFMGATYWMVPDESRTELYSTKLAYLQLVLWTLMGVTAVVGYLFRYGTGNKLLEQPLPHKIVIVICMLIFLYNIGMTIWKSKRFTTTEGVLILGLGLAAVLYLPALLEYENYTVAIFYRWWTIHLWVEGVWEMIQGGFLAYLLIRLSGADREVMEKWLYVIVGLVFIAGILGTAHHYYWVGVPSYWLPIGGIFSALEPAALVGMAIYAYSAMRRSGMSHPNTLALHWTLGSAVFTLFGAGLLGLAHTFPDVNKWTHGTLITAMHGHAAFYGAYLTNMLEVTKSVHEKVVYQSDTERSFAEDLEKNTAVKLYAKLPAWFKVPTPLGNYNPDWAVVVNADGTDRLYFVVETKSTLFDDALRDAEVAKIACGREHFATIAEGADAAKFVRATSVDAFSKHW